MNRSFLTAALAWALTAPAAAAADAPTIGDVTVAQRASDHLVLNASVSPNGSTTMVHVEFGESRALGGRTDSAPVNTDTESTLVTITLRKLSPGHTYYFQVVATNDSGTTRSEISSAVTSTHAKAQVLKGTEVSFAISTGRGGLAPWKVLAMRLPRGLPGGTRVSLRCQHACRGGASVLSSASRRQMRFGGGGITITRQSVLELRETRAGYVGRIRRFVFRRSGSLLEAFRTLSRCLVGSPARIAACPK